MLVKTRVCAVAYETNGRNIDIYFDADREDIAILKLSAVNHYTSPTRKWPVIGENGEEILFEFERVSDVEELIRIYPDCEVYYES